MICPAFFFILVAAGAAAAAPPLLQNEALRMDEEGQAGSLALLQLRATAVNSGERADAGAVLAADVTTRAGAAAETNSSNAAAAVLVVSKPHSASHNASHTAVQAPAAEEQSSSSSATIVLESQAPQVFPSWANIVYQVNHFRITPDFWPALTRSFCVVGIAELFDKTWFVALICALSFGIRNAFFGSFAALLLHTLIAAALGLGISQFLPISVLHFITAGVFAVFAGLFTWEWFSADPDTDALLSRKEEAKEDLGETQAGAKGKSSAFLNIMLWQCFTSVFIAEWGDRTQIAMIALHSSLPVLPVCIGSALAFFVLTLSAVLLAALLDGQRLSEKCVCGVSAVSFCVFALLAVVDGVRARQAELAV